MAGPGGGAAGGPGGGPAGSPEVVATATRTPSGSALSGPVRIKVCCIASLEEVRLAVHYGADAVGLVSAMPSGPGPIPEAEIARIAARVPPGVATFLLTCETEAGAIVDQQRRCGCDVLQLVARTDPAEHEKIKAALPGVRVVQVVHVTGEEAVHEAEELARTAHAILLDSGNPSLPVQELGGTGRTHDWSLSRRIVESVAVPVFLAGGLRSDNVETAIAATRPFAVDLCSGLRTEGLLDEEKLRSFVEAVARADR